MVKAPKDGRCEKCRWFYNRGDGSGACVRFPPTAMGIIPKDSAETYMGLDAAWPASGADDSCGEFEPHEGRCCGTCAWWDDKPRDEEQPDWHYCTILPVTTLSDPMHMPSGIVLRGKAPSHAAAVCPAWRWRGDDG